MPIGKNAIKRVENNGYSKVETSAPDMEHSVIANPDPQVVETLIVPVEKTAKKRAPAKKKTCAKKPAECTAKEEPAVEKDGFVRVEVGGAMPYYLL